MANLLAKRITVIEASMQRFAKSPLKLSGLGVLFGLEHDPVGVRQKSGRGMRGWYNHLGAYVRAAKEQKLRGNDLLDELTR